MKFSIPAPLVTAFQRPWLRRLTVGLASALLLYILAGFVGVPLVLRHMVLGKINQQLVGTLDVKSIRFNPFSWKLQLRDFRALSPDGVEAASFAELRINLQASSFLSKTKAIREIYWAQPDCTLAIDADGRVNLASVFGLKEPAPKEDSKPLVLPSLRIEHLEVRDAGLHFRLEGPGGAFERKLDPVSFVMSDLRTDPDRENPYRFALATAKGERLTVEGALRFDPLSSTGSVSLETLQLPDFTRFSSVLGGTRIEQGELDLQLEYRFKPLASSPEFGIENGQLEMRELQLVEAGQGQPLHQVDLLQLEGAHFDITGRSAGIESLSIDGASLLVQRSPGGEFHLLPEAPTPATPKPESAPTTTATKTRQPLELGVVAADRDMGSSIEAALLQLRLLSGAEEQSATDSGMTLTLGTCRVANSRLRIRDSSLTPAMNLTANGIEITTEPYASSEGQALPFSLAMQLDGSPTGTLRAKGSLLPGALMQATEIDVTAEELSLTPFSGYLVAAIGRPATAGTLSGELTAQIRKGAIEVNNQLRIHRLKFGPRFESSEAPRLPVELARAILEDREGNIHLDIPVKGDLKQPEFSTDRMVSYAIRNVIEKVVSAPFEMLGSLLPEGSGKPDSIEFAAGSSQLPKGSEGSLKAIAKIMKSRPRLLLQLTPAYSVKQDAKAWSERRFEEKLAAEMAKGEDRKDAIKDLNRELPRSQRVSILGFGKTEEMEAAVRQSLAATTEDLQQLARNRAEAVEKALIGYDVPAKRIEVAKEAKPDSRELSIGLGM